MSNTAVLGRNSCDSVPAISELLNERSDKALSELLHFYRPLLAALADRELEFALRSKLDASDIVQETCQEVARRFSSIRAQRRTQFWAYLLITMRHKIEDARRRFKRSKSRAMRREVSIESLELAQTLAQRHSLPVDALIQSEDIEKLNMALDCLAPELQDLLHWRFRLGMSYVEIGGLVERSSDDVRMLIKRCLMKFRNELECHDIVAR